ncbi:unnamed protein product [Adineta steineri]|uniref:Uncharacterized protein n=1 Tax=Adineta steineri TaxID=433720 RepID=A0A815HY80_9BILA|nr:unnamed protein product [Adineta steineri]CAF1360447.1 unnamed protein product [Adineta steineri]
MRLIKATTFGIALTILLLWHCDARRIRIRTGSSGGSSNDSSSSPLKTILGIFAMILIWGCALGAKVYKCHRNGQRRNHMQQSVAYAYRYPLQPLNIHQEEERNLTNIYPYTIVQLPIPSDRNGWK